MPARDASVDTKVWVLQELAQALVVKTLIRTIVEQRFVVQDSVHLRGGKNEKGRIRRGGGGRERERGRGEKGRERRRGGKEERERGGKRERKREKERGRGEKR
jgi:hypothetical protein